MLFASDAGQARERAARTRKISLVPDAERAAPACSQLDLEKTTLAIGLGVPASRAGAVGTLALIDADTGKLPLLHTLTAGLSIAVPMTTIIRLSERKLAPIATFAPLSGTDLQDRPPAQHLINRM
jgi:hypothetical protein